MRLLISVILTSFFFLSSQHAVAAGKNGFNKKAVTERGSEARKISAEFIHTDDGLILVQQFSLRTPSSQYRNVQGFSPEQIYLPASVYKTLSVAELTTRASSHCVPIGQKLLYPKHYFW